MSCPFCKCGKTPPLLHYRFKSHLDKAVLHKGEKISLVSLEQMYLILT